MADGTSVGKVQLDVELNKESISSEIKNLNNMFKDTDLGLGLKNSLNSISESINNFINKDITRLTDSIKESVDELSKVKAVSSIDAKSADTNVIEKGFKSMFSRIKTFAQESVNKTTNDINKFATAGKSSNDKVSASIDKMNAEYEKTEAKIKEIRNEMSKLFAEQDSITNEMQKYPAFSGMSKDESMDEMIKSNPQYNVLSEQIDKLTAKMDPLIEKNKKLAEEIKNTGKSANESGRRMKFFGKNSEKAGKSADKASKKTRTFGNEMQKGGGKAAGFAAMLNKSFMTILRRLFVYNLIMKGIRGIMSYMGAALKTNKQFTNSLNIIKTNLMVAFQPIYDYILPAINALMQGVARVTTYVASAISSLLGKTYQQSFNAAKGLQASKKAMDEYGKSAKNASGSLAGFDEINQIDTGDSDASSGAGGFEMVMPETSTINLTGFERFKALLNPITESLGKLKTGLEPLKSFAAKGLNDFYNNFLVPVGGWVLGEGLPRFIDAITNGLSLINWESINSGLNNLWYAITPFAINVGEGLLWFWENVLTPLGTWAMNEVVPLFLNILAEAFRIINEVIGALQPMWQWLWDSFFVPIAEWTGGIVVSVLEGLRKALNSIGNWIAENQSAIENMTIVIGSFMAAWGIVNLAQTISGIVAALITYIATGGLATAVTTALGTAVGFLTSPITIVIAIIGALIAVGVLLYKNWDKITEWAGKLWENIKNIFGKIGDWISGVWDSIMNGAKAVGNFLKGIFDGIAGFFKNIVNGVIKALNFMIRALNKLSFDVPEWVPGIGGKKFGFNLKEIPLLARGGIVDQPTLAMVGERGKEAVMPLENNTGWIDNLAGQLAMKMGGPSGSTQDAGLLQQVVDVLLRILDAIINNDGDTILQVGQTELGRATIRAINAVQKQEGRLLLEL